MRTSTPDPARLGPPQDPASRIPVGGAAVAGLACATGAMLAASAAHGSPVEAGTVADAWTAFAEWLAASYVRAPALVLGLAALVAVPPLAIVGLLVRRREAATRDVSELNTQVRRPVRAAAPEPRDGVRTGHIPLRPLEAWVEIQNRDEVAPGADTRYRLQRTLVRIGRESDNDVHLVDTTVHRYHAAIHRTEDAEFVITDLSSAGGNGVVVNGRAVAEARLSNGDVIELGNARLRFSAAPHA